MKGGGHWKELSVRSAEYLLGDKTKTDQRGGMSGGGEDLGDNRNKPLGQSTGWGRIFTNGM